MAAKLQNKGEATTRMDRRAFLQFVSSSALVAAFAPSRLAAAVGPAPGGFDVRARFGLSR